MTLAHSLGLARAPLAAFAAMGMVWGGYAAVLPDLLRQFAVNEAQMGALMFPTPVAAVCAMLLAPVLGRLLGGIALPVAALWMVLAFALPGHAGAAAYFPPLMMLCGFGTGLTDVLMNARVAELENRHGHPLMNLCHAIYSFGYVAGALLTGALREADQPPAIVMGAFAALAACLALMTIERDGKINGLARPANGQPSPLGLLPFLGGLMVLIAFMTENAAENWSALHIEKTLGGNPSHGALGPALIALTMGIARLGGHAISQRIAPQRLLSLGAAVAALGALVAAGALNAPMAYLGFVIMGAGASVIAPTAFTLVGAHASAETRARAIARATLLGYLGYFIGPPLLGMIAGHLSLRLAFCFAALLLVLVPILTRALMRQIKT